jgi:hypothetical protein
MEIDLLGVAPILRQPIALSTKQDEIRMLKMDR